ncbi:HD superfamily phosphohydrolase [Halalkaliarchaeum sp. AArc-CO]|uniref:HD domain-containing protein n=1 Tax=unclassified Halalkaliarchaeum TaxID=2678344 RepID=UPI00217D6EBE|nr:MULTISPECIES: HD domain-containing protein [unclassified Halalkaliarchaeum]MDR5673954.1 HD domain-containing protein [Halalkaliarchaeum sp. AArc-GB]UWG50590.1 HD superfamily phosphohydrolase [Halalkaliarchaeum sp. AArc-CO]
MTPVKDSVHDYIPLDPVAAELIDTPVFQRLRHIKQLSTVRLVYPSANHTRFEHSLGVYHLTSRSLETLDVDEDRARHARAAALLHDIGHGPYGHQTEELIRRHTGKDHDDVEWLVTDADREVTQVLEKHGLEPERIAGLVRGDGPLGDLVSGELDADRMDYLVRDAHHTGVPYGTIDHGRLVRELTLRDGRLVLAEGNVPTAESLLLARGLMNAIVYRHHVSRIAGAMLERASERLLDAEEGSAADVDVETFRRMADHDLLVRLREGAPDLARRLERRELFKRAVWAERSRVPAGTADVDRVGERAAAREIADQAGIDPGEVIVDIPSRPTLKESNATVVVDGTPQRLEDASELVTGLRSAQQANWRLGVYCPARHRESVADAAERVLDLQPGRAGAT